MTSKQRCLIAVAVGLLVFAFTRIRGFLPFYVAGHTWLHEQGVPPHIRNLDTSLLLVLGAIAAGWIANRGKPLRALRLAGSTHRSFAAALRQGLQFGLLASIPMLAQAAIASDWVQFNWNTIKGGLIAPFVEETFFRGLLVIVPVSLARCRFGHGRSPHRCCLGRCTCRGIANSLLTTSGRS